MKALEAIAARSIRLADRKFASMLMANDAGSNDLGCRIDDATDGPCRAEQTELRAVGIDAR